MLTKLKIGSQVIESFFDYTCMSSFLQKKMKQLITIAKFAMPVELTNELESMNYNLVKVDNA